MHANSQIPVTDEEGFLVEPRDWNEDIAKQFALLEGIQPTKDHWEALNQIAGMKRPRGWSTG